MTPAQNPIAPTAADLDRIKALYNQGLCLQAYAAAEPLGPLPRWQGTAARLLAGRLALNLGAPRMSRRLHLSAWRADRQDPEACYYYAFVRVERFGLLATWRYLQNVGELPDAPADLRADWFAFHARVLGKLRDFAAAEQWLARAERLAPNRPWICIERNALLEEQDQYEAALAAARRALELRPWYRPGVQCLAHALLLCDRTDEALDLLRTAADRMESFPVLTQLGALQTELGLHADGRRTYERITEVAPLLEPDLGRWLAARRADTAYYLGDFAETAAWARKTGDPLLAELADRLTAPPDEGRRVTLPLGFIRQHYLTCAPATLAAIARFWGMPADHLELAAEICYDGTPDHSERHWAEQNGWRVREFAVTWDSARALIDRGVPFTLTTTEATSSHLQAVFGYDTRRRTLLIRDPSQRHFGEAIVEPFLRRYAAHGPRGMALVPAARADLLAGLDLPAAGLYDHHYQLRRALFRHDRPAAAAALGAMRAADAGHRLTLHAGWDLARYDGDWPGCLAAVERLRELFPEDDGLQLARLSYLRDQAQRGERFRLLEELCARPRPHPAFLGQFAQLLREDARQQPRAERLLRKALRWQPAHAPYFFGLGHLLHDRRQFPAALEAYRFAACLDDRNEQFAEGYFEAARQLGQADAALRYLEDRFARFGRQSGQPARTLAWALDELERGPEAFAVLDRALAQRPDDGELCRHAAEEHGRHGRFARAAELLAAAAGRCHPAGWRRAAARLATWEGRPAEALDHWRQVVADEPLALDGHRALAQLIAAAQGTAAALDHLRQAIERFPHHVGLGRLYLEWLNDEGPEAQLPAVRAYLERHPGDAWAHREVGFALAELGRLDEAFAAAEVAQQLDPTAFSTWNLRGRLCALAGRTAEARAAYEEAIRLSVDDDYAIGQLMGLCDTLAERRAALDFVRQELTRQVTLGDGLLAYRQAARNVLEPAELEATLREAWRQRPDLWHAWSALIRQLADLDCLDEADALAGQAVERFPLLPRLWVDRSQVCRARDDSDGEVAALQQALAITPGWGVPLRLLAAVYEREDDYARSRELLEGAVARSPLEAVNHGCLADTLWHLGEREEALDRVRHALRLDPGYEWAWDRLREWGAELERPEAVAEAARDLTTRRPGEARSWMVLARALPDDAEEALAALDAVLRLQPRHTEARDLRAERLAKAERFDEALAACTEGFGDASVPGLLRGRAAWVVAQSGALAGAIARMRPVLAEDPDYYWGWRQLADWVRETGDHAGYREAAEALVRLGDPTNPVPWGLLGEAKHRQGDRAGAKKAYAKAFAIDPSYGFAGLSLCDEQIEDGELDAAAATVAALREHDDDAFLTARAVQIAARRGDRAAAAAELHRLFLAADEEPWPFDAAAEACADAGWERLLEDAARKALDEEAVNPRTGPLWVKCRARRAALDLLPDLDALAGRGEVGRRVVLAYAEELRKAGGRRLRECVERYREPLREVTSAWGRVGWMLSEREDWAGAAAWMADWADRTDAAPVMLINLVLALHALCRHDEARQVSERAVTLEADFTTPYHHVWLAAATVLAGEDEAAEAHLEKAGEAEDQDTYHRILYQLAAGVLAVRRGGPFAAARRAVQEAVAANRAEVERDPQAPRPDPAMRWAYRRLTWAMARAGTNVAVAAVRFGLLWTRLAAGQKGKGG